MFESPFSVFDVHSDGLTGLARQFDTRHTTVKLFIVPTGIQPGMMLDKILAKRWAKHRFIPNRRAHIHYAVSGSKPS